MARGGVVERVRAMANGPAPALPSWMDRVAEGWASLSPRGRWLLGACAVVVFLAGLATWAAGVAERWGGAPVTVLVATSDLAPGQTVEGLRPLELPPAAVPSGAVRDVAEGTRLAFALPAGSVLTRGHLDARGPGAALPATQRALPVPVEEGWGITAGGWVDVWVPALEDRPGKLVASGCAVLAVSQGDTGPGTALVALPRGAVGEVAQGLTAGRVLLAHAPPPGPGEARC